MVPGIQDRNSSPVIEFSIAKSAIFLSASLRWPSLICFFIHFPLWTRSAISHSSVGGAISPPGGNGGDGSPPSGGGWGGGGCGGLAPPFVSLE